LISPSTFLFIASRAAIRRCVHHEAQIGQEKEEEGQWTTLKWRCKTNTRRWEDSEVIYICDWLVLVYLPLFSLELHPLQMAIKFESFDPLRRSD
jgi:hypothetical protein